MKIRFRPLVLVSLAVMLAAGCATAPEPIVHSPRFEPVRPVADVPARLPTGSIYDGPRSDQWFGRGRAFHVGDVITVLLNESTSAERAQSANVSREASNDVLPRGVSTKLGSLASPLTGISLNGANVASSGTGAADQRASLSGSVSVTVVEVLANGNLVVRGEKQLALSEGTEIVQISGVIRPEDVSRNNLVQSRRLANAQIAYRGTGALANASRPGWGTNLLMKFWPF